MKSINILSSPKKKRITWILEECDNIQEKGLVVYDPKTNIAMHSEHHIGESGFIVLGVSEKTWENLDAIPPVTDLMAELGLVFSNEEELSEILMSINFERDHLKERSERKEEERNAAIAQAEKWAKEEAEEQKESPTQSKEAKLYDLTKELFVLFNKDLDNAKASNPFMYYLVCVTTAKNLQEAIDLGKKKGLTDSMIEQLMEESGILNHFTRRK